MISLENILREYEANSENIKQKHRMKKLANIKEENISPFIKKGVEEFRKLANQIMNEINERRGIK